MKPKRIQLQRTKGWRMPAGAVKVDRSTRWGNPYKVGGHADVLLELANRPLGLVPAYDGPTKACEGCGHPVAPADECGHCGHLDQW